MATRDVDARILSVYGVGRAVRIDIGPGRYRSAAAAAVSRQDYGINVFSYDSQMNSPSTIAGMTTLGMGMQQFPNANEWSWTTNTFRDGGTAPVSLSDWGSILEQTNNQGLFIFDYDENPTFTGGGSPADATQLTQYIVSHHLPITAIVVGSEEYGSWDHYANLNPSFSASYYATRTAEIAQAIHQVDPAMQVGVSFDLGQEPSDLQWDQTVLRTDGPYINFVSIHDYPNAQTLSNAGLLAALPSEIHQAMTFVQNEIATNVPAPYAANIQTWVTEFNPYGEPGPQSTQPVYGAAMVESAMLWRVDGAAKLFVWSYDGQAHSPSAQWPVDTTANTAYGLFALAGDGQSPELPENQLYPSGLSLAQYMQAIGTGGTLSVWVTPDQVVGDVQSSSGASHIFAINTSNAAETLGLGGTQTVVPAATMLATSGQTITPATLTLTPGPTPPIALATSQPGLSAYQPVPPAITDTLSGYPGETVTLTGRGFGQWGANAGVVISQNGVNYGGPLDSYGVTIKSWSPTRISFVVPNGTSGPSLTPGSATVLVETANQLVSNSTSLTVTAAPNLNLTLSSQSPYPGDLLTIFGSGFGAAQGTGYVQFSQNGINYGGPGDAYHVSIVNWSNSAITVEVPNGSSGPALTPGSATLTVVTGSGTPTPALSLTIVPPPLLSAAISPPGPVQPGQLITVSGNNFGSSQGTGYVLIQQNGVNYGEPGDWYGVSIVTWTNNSITFRVPIQGMSSTGHEEPSLQPGSATMTVVSGAGLQSPALPLTVN
ncbi:MAG: cell surface protein [Sulfobacillus acidophilus]|uniref:Cell surface protein n=1 Tax=Sulfobacillus acidophilus TaxID=53633 RepID=A0A2T2WKD1_9FIRM|nr:MAG: cell surface protein [Sulfobacillus acidophilus]